MRAGLARKRGSLLCLMFINQSMDIMGFEFGF